MKTIKTPASAQADQTRQTTSNHSAPIQQVATESMFVDHRPEMTAQRQRLSMMSNSPQIQQQKARQNSIDNSPQTLAQLKQHNTFFGSALQRQEQAAPKPNRTGLPDQLKSGIESLSGISMDHVKVHYNSSQPAQLNALAYAQGSDIHVGPGQEQHLPHEAWHVVQQAQGRVKPTMQMKEGVPVNDDAGLEHEADVMGAKALQKMSASDQVLKNMAPLASTAIQRVALAATANLGWDAAGAETWAGNASNPAPIGPNLNSLVAANVLTAANAASGFVSGHVIAAAMGGVNAIGNIVGWDDNAHETPQTAFEQAIYHGGAALHGFGALAAPEASETGTVTVAANIGGAAAVTTVRDAWVTALSTHVFNNVATLQGNGGLTRNPAIPPAAPVIAPTQAAMTNAFNISLGGGHAVEYVARIPDAYTISYAPTNGGHSNAASRTSQLTQVSLPTVAFNAGSTPQEQFDAMRGNNATLRFGQWILSAV